jgi:hypothetical protein
VLKPYFRTGLYMSLLFFVPAVLWDYVAMKSGIWYFIGPFIAKLSFGYFPAEEFILIFSVPWFVLTATVLFGRLFGEDRNKSLS